MPVAASPVSGLWFEPRMLIIRAEEKLFRVPADQLAKISTVFADMLLICGGGGGGGGEEMDGHPVVRLEDSAADVECFLRAIFYSDSFFLPAPADVDFRVVFGVLRMSHKYHVQFLYRRALDHVDGQWYRPTFYDSSESCDLGPVQELYDSQEELFSAIVTAARTGVQWILPFLYYLATVLPSDKLLTFIAHHETVLGHAVKVLAVREHILQSTITFYGRYENKVDRDPYGSAGPTKALESLVEWQGGPPKARALGDKFWKELPAVLGLPSRRNLEKIRQMTMDEVQVNTKKGETTKSYVDLNRSTVAEEAEGDAR
ncbi:hypothetical protein C8R46DRAFT_879790 [Mycena filopes]|nr:hypothetical protein C8R46DRAFT_879790 [Mycena filopes]